MITIKIKRFSKDVAMPNYSYPGDAAFDLCARVETAVPAGEKREIPSGLFIELPKGYAGLVWDKSSIGIKQGIKTLGGVLDSGYRGEIIVGVVNLTKKDYTFEKGHKVAQLVIQKIEIPKIKEVKELSDSKRGAKGFGSAGK